MRGGIFIVDVVIKKKVSHESSGWFVQYNLPIVLRYDFSWRLLGPNSAFVCTSAAPNEEDCGWLREHNSQ